MFSGVCPGRNCVFRFHGLDDCNWLLDRILQQTPQSPNAVSPTDFFAFFVGASSVADADFVNPKLAFGDFDCDLWLEAETVLFNGNRLNDLAPENLVAGFHVGQVDVGQAVGDQSQNPI